MVDYQQGRQAVLGWQRTVDAAYQQQQGALGSTALPAASPEYTEIQRFIHDEMVRNSGSSTVKAIKGAIAAGDEQSKAAAYLVWANKVRPGGDWDHKTDILNRTAGTNTFTPLPGGNGNIRYDLWSNVHYGYVGREAGFTGGELRAGANAADIVGQDRTDPGDDVAVRIGLELRERYAPDQLRPEHINEAIERHRAELERTGMIGPRLK